MDTRELVAALKNDTGLQLHAQAIVTNEKLLRVVDRLTQELAMTKDKPHEVSHPVRKQVGRGVWACSNCLKAVPMRDITPKYPRCPYCGVKYSGKWTAEAHAIDQKEV